MVSKIITKKRVQTTTTVDLWGRSAVHLATQYGRVLITSKLLREDSQIDNADELGLTPLEYLFDRGGKPQDVEDCEEEDTGQASSSRSETEPVQEPRMNPEHSSNDGASEDLGNAIVGSAGHQENDTKRVSETKDAERLDEIIAEPIDGLKEDAVEPMPQTSDDEQQDLVNRKRDIFVEIASKRSYYREDRERTLLYYAVEHTDIETIRKLTSSGYELEVRDATGLTPLHFAIQIKRSEIALELLRDLESQDKAALKSATDDRGYTPLMFAAENGSMGVVKHLVKALPEALREECEHVANREAQKTEFVTDEDETSGPLAKNLDGRTALHIALSCGMAPVARYLLAQQKEFQKEPVDNLGNSLLVAACSHQQLADCVHLILDKWPEFIDRPDTQYGQTPLSFACESGTVSVVELLLSAGNVNINAKATG